MELIELRGRTRERTPILFSNRLILFEITQNGIAQWFNWRSANHMLLSMDFFRRSTNPSSPFAKFIFRHFSSPLSVFTPASVLIHMLVLPLIGTERSVKVRASVCIPMRISAANKPCFLSSVLKNNCLLP